MKPKRTLLILFSIITIIVFSGFTFFQTRSYYVDSDTGATRGAYPDNRYYRYEGEFYSIFLQYPADLYARYLGQEVFLQYGGCTHFISLVVKSELNLPDSRKNVPVRYRIQRFELKTLDGEIIPVQINQMDMYRDFLRKAAGNQEKSTAKMIPGVLQEITRSIPSVDFNYESNLDEVYFGYILKEPPQKLTLEFELEVYTLSRSKKDVFKASIPLQLVLGDPAGWVKSSVRGRQGSSNLLSTALGILLLPLAIPFAVLTGSIIYYADNPPKSKLKMSQEQARNNLKNADQLTSFDLAQSLHRLNQSKDPALIPHWLRIGKDAIVKGDRYGLRSSLENLSRYYGNYEALAAIEQLEKELKTSSAPKTKMMFSYLFGYKQDAINPPYRFVNEEVLSKSDELMTKYLEIEESYKQLRKDKELVQRGDALTKEGRFEAALPFYKGALRSEYVFTDEERMEAKRRIVKNLLLSGRYEEALNEYMWMANRTSNKSRSNLKIQQIEALINYKKTGNPLKIYQYLEQAETDIHFKDFYNAEALFLYGVVGDSEKGIALVDDMIGPLKSVPELSQVKSSVDAEMLIKMNRGNRRSLEAKEKLTKYYLLREAFVKSRTENRTGEITKLVASLSEYYLL